MPPKKLKAELYKIRDVLPSNLRIPGHRQGINMAQLYNLMSVKTKVNANYAMFLVQLPLILEHSFEQFRVIPIPLNINGEFLEIKRQRIIC